jgi:transcriptional regulator with XRE-family HTH domain
MQEVIISKIESGERPARITEALGLAQCFGVSVDALLGRGTERLDNREYALRSLRITADRSAHQIRDIANALDERLTDMYGTGLTLEEWPAEGWRAWNAMNEATSALNEATSALLELAQEKESE